MISQLDATAPEELVVLKKRRDTSSVTYSLSSATGELDLIWQTRVNVTTEKCIPKKQKYIKPKSSSPFLPGNKISLNEDDDDDPETTATSLSGKYDMSHTSPDDFTEKKTTKKLQIMMTNTRRKHQKLRKVMKVLII